MWLLACSHAGGHWVDNNWPVRTVEMNPSEQLHHSSHWLGPLFSTEYEEPNQNVRCRAIRPLYVEFFDHTKETRDCYFLYPLFRKHVSPKGVRWSIFNLIQKRDEVDDPRQKRFRIFPFFSMDYSEAHHDKSSESIFPVSGGIDHFMGRDSVSWVAFPFYWKSTRGDETFHSMFWPIIHVQRGPKTGGGAFFPLYGHMWKTGVYDKRYVLWPLMFDQRLDLDTPNPCIRRGVLPLYTLEQRPNYKAVCYAWPFFGYTHKLNPKYDEWRFLWPLLVQGRGDIRYINRWAPFFTHSKYQNNEKWWFLWPTLRVKQWTEADLKITQTQLFFFLIWSQTQTSLKNPQLPSASKNHIWPLVSTWDNGAGHKQFQIFSPFESFFPHNLVVRKVYTPLFALYRYERNAEHQSAHYSFLFNLVTLDKKPKAQQLTIGPLLTVQSKDNRSEIQILKGLLGYSNDNGTRKFRFLWFLGAT